MIPFCAKARLNIRYNTLHTAQSLLNDLKTAKSDFFASSKNLSVTLQENSDPFICNDEKLIQHMKLSIIEILGTEADISAGGGTTDGRFVSKYCPVVEFGIPEDEVHKANESVATDDIIKLTEVYKKFYAKFFAIDKR